MTVHVHVHGLYIHYTYMAVCVLVLIVSLHSGHHLPAFVWARLCHSHWEVCQVSPQSQVLYRASLIMWQTYVHVRTQLHTGSACVCTLLVSFMNLGHCWLPHSVNQQERQGDLRQWLLLVSFWMGSTCTCTVLVPKIAPQSYSTRLEFHSRQWNSTLEFQWHYVCLLSHLCELWHIHCVHVLYYNYVV